MLENFGSLYLSVCLCLFVSLRLDHCHHQMISFQKIYGLYGPEYHIVETNGDVTMWEKQTNNNSVTQLMDTEHLVSQLIPF